MKELSTLFKNRNFMHLWISQILSQLVVNSLSFMMLIYLFEETGSTIATSLIWIAYALPAVLFGPIAAVAADVFDKRKLLTVTLLIQSLTVALFALLQGQYLYLAYGVVFAYSLANQFYIPAEAATLPLIVPKNILPFANSLFFITVQSAIAFGLLSAGASYEYLGLGASLFLAAALLILAYTSVSLLPQIRPLERIPEDISRGVARFFAELVEGYQFIKSNQKIFMPFLLLIGLQVSLSVVIVTLPALAKDLIGVKPSLAGIAIGLPAAIGALTATAVVPKAIARGIKRRRVVELSLFFLSIAIVVLGSIVPNVHFWVGRTLAVACFVVAGASYVGSLIPTLTHLQITTPKDKLGRVFGNIWLITTAATVVPVIFSATITEVFGVSLMMSLLGLVGMTTFFLLEVRKSSFIKINGGL